MDNIPITSEQFHENGVCGNRQFRLAGGLLHRLDGPAYESFFDNSKINFYQYYAYGVLHRLDGPAWETFDKINNYRIYSGYYIRGINLSLEQFRVHLIVLNDLENLRKTFGLTLYL